MAKRTADSEEPDVGALVKELRTLLGLTQEQVADRGGIRREEVVKVEGGLNNATSWRLRDGIGFGLGLSRDGIAQLLSGEITVAEAFVVAKTGAGAMPSGARPATRTAAAVESVQKGVRRRSAG